MHAHRTLVVLLLAALLVPAAATATTAGADHFQVNGTQSTNGTSGGSTTPNATAPTNSTGNLTSGSGGNTSGNSTGGSSTTTAAPIKVQLINDSHVQDVIIDALGEFGTTFINDHIGNNSHVARKFANDSIVYGVPAPGEPGRPTTWYLGSIASPSTWGQFDDAWWNKTWAFYWIFGLLGFAGLLPAVMLGWGKSATRPARQSLSRAARGFLIIIVGWFIIAFLYHVTNIVSMQLAPSSEATLRLVRVVEQSQMSLSYSLVKLGKSTLLLTSYGTAYVQYIMAYAAAAVWPLVWVLNAYRSSMARSAGKIGLVFMGGLLVLKPLQALLMNLLTGMHLAGTPTVRAQAASAVGVTAVFIVFPYLILVRMMPRALIVYGLHEVRKKGHDERRYQERIGNVRRKFAESVRGRGPNATGQLPTRTGRQGRLPSSERRALNAPPSADRGRANAASRPTTDDSRAMQRARDRIDDAADLRDGGPR
ncbi:MAG: hypothetical protein ABEJ31_03105 [Haloarculaceae archaeon]